MVQMESCIGVNEDIHSLTNLHWVYFVCFVSFCLIQPVILQFVIQGYKLSQKASVWENPAFLLHAAHRGQKTEVVMNHQVGKDQCS